VTSPVCGIESDGTLDYSQGGDNWCGLCRNGKSQSPVDVSTISSRNNLIDMVDANMSFGVLRKAWLDVEKNWITMNYFSDGYLRLEGYLPSANMMDRNIIKVLYRPVGIVFFHSPSEHTFNGNSYDVEMQVLFTDKYYNLAMVSVFFD